MKAVWKFPLLVDDTTKVRMPRGSRVVHVAATGVPDELVIWAEVHPGASEVEHTFHVAGTGHPMPEDGREHVATVFAPFGLVWHLYRPGDAPGLLDGAS